MRKSIFLPNFRGTHLLKIVPGSVGVIILGTSGLIFLFWPVLDHYLLQKIDRIFSGRLEIGLIIGILALGTYLGWALMETKP